MTFAAGSVTDAQAAGPPVMLAFTAPVTSATTTQPWSARVAVEDSLKNVVASDNSDRVALAIALGTGAPNAVLSCRSGVVATVSSGVAQFTGCTIDKPGPAYELTAASGALTQATSSIFNVFSPVSTRLALTESPSDTPASNVLSPQPTFTVEDQVGNIVTGDQSTVTLSITGGTPASGGPGSLTGCLQSETNGVVTFSGCKITTPGVGYELHATDGSLTPVDTDPFTINPVVPSPRINCGLISGPLWQTHTAFGRSYRVSVVGSGATCKTARRFAAKMVTTSWAKAPTAARALLPEWHCNITRGAHTSNAVAGRCTSSSNEITWDEGDGEFNPAACSPGKLC
jgi:hypothetical protein